jgi:hypothetical protein
MVGRPIITWNDVRVALVFAALVIVSHLDLIVWP